MGAHTSAADAGSSWNALEAVDVDQPHGNDYLYSQNIAKGVRKRSNKEHVAFGDSTAGGEHIPGKANVVDILDSTSDLTDYFDDGSYGGGGLVWCISTGTHWGALFVCATADGSYSAADATILKLHPDLQWGGGDVTWQGAHAFQGNVDMSDVDITGTLDVSGSVGISGDVTIEGTLKVGTDVTITGDMAIDGTANFYDEVDISSVNLSGLSGLFGTYTRLDAASNDITRNQVYQVSTDGIINGYTKTTNGKMTCIVDDVTDMDVTVDAIPALSGHGSQTCFPVAKGNYFAISSNVAGWVITWQPIGAGTCTIK